MKKEYAGIVPLSPKTNLKKMMDPFKENEVSKLPKPKYKDAKKDFCDECGGYHGMPAVHLSYVGHAALTKRLLEVDPFWNWEPLSYDNNGFPRIVDGMMWIRLTVCGVTRLGVGDAQGKSGPNAVKEIIGDALRNAAMRFGAALDLWHKGDLFMQGIDEEDDPPIVEPKGYTLSQPDLDMLDKWEDVLYSFLEPEREATVGMLTGYWENHKNTAKKQMSKTAFDKLCKTYESVYKEMTGA